MKLWSLYDEDNTVIPEPTPEPVQQVVIYNNRPYHLVWRGITKNGSDKANLKFIGGDKNFWVNSEHIDYDTSLFVGHKFGIGRCRECGRGLRDASYHVAMGGLCGECAFDEYDM